MGFIPKEATIASYHAALNQGEYTCEEMVRYYLERIRRYDKGDRPLHAIIFANPRAIEEARALDKRIKGGEKAAGLFGVPVLVKDNIETEDMPTTAGSRSLEGWESHRDSFIIKKLRGAGAILLAKTNLHEFAVWGETVSSILGQSYNPYDFSRTPGGSSGGTGAGLAADFGMVGLGTDTINSIRSPSSACNLCGIRPTIGLVSRSGIVPYSLTQDTAGPLARTVEDAVKTLEVIAGADPEDPVTEKSAGRIPPSYQDFLQKDGLLGKKIGVLRSFMGEGREHEPVNRVMEACFSRIQEGGAHLVDIKEEFDSSYLVQEVSLHLHDLKADLENYLQSFGDRIPVHSIEEILDSGKYSPDIRDNLLTARELSKGTPYYDKRLHRRRELQEKVLDIMDEYGLDAIIYPHQQQLVCKAGESQKQRNGVIGSVTGFPAMVVPAGFSRPNEQAPLGVPVGLEILGRPFDEGILIEIASGIEAAESMRKPPVI